MLLVALDRNIQSDTRACTYSSSCTPPPVQATHSKIGGALHAIPCGGGEHPTKNADGARQPRELQRQKKHTQAPRDTRACAHTTLQHHPTALWPFAHRIHIHFYPHQRLCAIWVCMGLSSSPPHTSALLPSAQRTRGFRPARALQRFSEV